MEHNNTFNGRRKLIQAVAMAVTMMGAPVAYATGICTAAIGTNAAGIATTTGAKVNGQICTDGNATLTNTSGTTIGITTATAAGNTVWIEGVGNVVNNAGTITRSSTTGNTVGVFIGDYTVARFSATGSTGAAGSGVTATTPAAGTGKNLSLVGTGSFASYGTIGNNQLILSQANLASAGITASSQLIGKTIKMNGIVVDGEARPGETATITAFDPATGIITVDHAWAGLENSTPGGPLLDQAGNGYNILAGTGTNIINNSGTISANYTGTATANVRAIDTNIAGDYIINNTGTISASHTSIGTPQGIDAGGDVTTMEVNNSGTISITRNEAITLTTNTATSLQASSASIAAANLGSAAAIYSQEELEAITINNRADGKIIGVGKFAPAIYLRAGEQTIVNEGEISGSREGTVGAYTYGMAIGSVSDGGEIRTLELENAGTINGDVLAVNGNAYRWYALSTSGTLDDRLNINSNWGQLDSIIKNSGTINGNLYFSNGKHELTNEEGATITGNIDVDQRDTICNNASGCSAGALGANTKQHSATNFTVVGSKDFTFENAGDFAGNLTIRTAYSTVLGGAAPVASTVTLIPTISGSGAGSTLEAPSHHIEGVGDTLTIDATAGAGIVTVAPKSLVTVHKGEYFLVADTLTLTGGATTPLVSGTNTPLVTWNIATNSSNNLVIGVDSVQSAATVAGVSSTSAAAIDALLTSNTTIGGALQGLTAAADIEKAGQQLRPEANNASMQASFAATDRVSSVIGARQDEVRVASNGSSGVSTGEAEQGRGFWIQGFGFKGDQDKRDGIDGYSASTGGFAFGGDAVVGNGDFRVGAALSYASTGIDGNGANASNRTDIDSYQGTLYGSWNTGTWYVDAALGYGRHTYDTKRLVTVGLVTDTVTGSHDGNQYLAKISAGYPMQWGKVIFTPLASATYVHLDQDGYTETGTAGAALVVNDTQTDSFRTGLGAKVKLPLSDGSYKTAVEARAIWNHEFGDNSQDVTARFAAGGASFTTNGVSLARDSANLGLGLNVTSANRQTLSVNYDADVKSDYTGHTASVQFRYDF